jgi:large subunit ribosomal protein L44
VIQLVAQACTHPSFVYVVRRAKDAQRKLQGARAAADPSLLFLDEIREETIQDNAHLAALGNSLLGLLGSEALHLKYPHLPTRVLKAALSAYVGPNTTADVGSELGLAGQGILRWDRGEMETDAEKEELRFKAKLSPLSTASISARKRKGAELPSTAINSRDARSLAVRALLGVIYQEKVRNLPSVSKEAALTFVPSLPLHQGVEAVKHILHTRFLSRRVDLASMLKFQDPKRVLSSTCAKYGRERPQSRLIAETGRLSNTPLYVVGVYSGKLKLGEGFGSSIKMAEFRVSLLSCFSQRAFAAN